MDSVAVSMYIMKFKKMNIKKPSFTENMKGVAFFEDEIHIHFHLRRNWNESDIIGAIILRYDDIPRLVSYDRRDRDGVYINDRAGSFSFYQVQNDRLSKILVVVFKNQWAGQDDAFGDPSYPHDEIVGVFKEDGINSIQVKYDKDWIHQPDDKLPLYPVHYRIEYDDFE